MSAADIKPVLRVEPSPTEGKLRIAITDGRDELASTEIDAWAASAIAVGILETARQIGHTPDRLNAPSIEGSFSAVPATSTTVIQSHVPECKTLVARFGQTYLGVAIHQTQIPALVELLQSVPVQRLN